MLPQTYLSISELSRLLNDTLETYVGESLFEGELQELTRAASGHLYCTIKDELSCLSIVLWSSAVRQLKFKPEKGMLVRCLGKPNIYSKTGRLQVIVVSMELAGEGALQKKFEELRKKLEAEGLFAPERKRRIPYLPKAIGLITSAKGAALHDIMTRLSERMPHIPVYLVDVRVQGEGAALEIAAAIQFLSSSGHVDVIICGRGGGSLQDLWAFNEEAVVRAIFASLVPVISAVGHEVDVTLADLVADLRAPTPTAAAEMVVPRRSELVRILPEFDRRLLDYSRWLMPKVQELDETFARLERALSRQVEGARYRTNLLEGRLQTVSPRNLLEMQKLRIAKMAARLDSAVGRHKLQVFSERLQTLHSMLNSRTLARLEKCKSQVARARSTLEALNPSSVLQRGFSITRKNGEVVVSQKQVRSGDKLAIQVSDGTIGSEVVN